MDAGNYRDDDGLDPSDLKVGYSKLEYMSSGFRLGDPGNRSFRCYVDYERAEIELNEDNNARTINFTVFRVAPHITIEDVYVVYDGKIVRNGGTGKKGKRYHPHVFFRNTGNGSMKCDAEAKYYINSNKFRDRDGIGKLGVNRTGHEWVSNDNIKLGDGGWRSYRVVITSSCGEFSQVSKTINFYLK